MPGARWLGTALRLAILATVPMIVLAGCGASGPQEVTQLITQQVDSDHDGDYGWLRIRLSSSPAAPMTPDEVSLEVTGPDGPAPARLCTSPDLAPDGCQDPFDGEDTWQRGGSLYLPCPSAGPHTLTLEMPRGYTYEETFDCDEAAEASQT